MDRTGWIVVVTCGVLMMLWYTMVLPKMAPVPVKPVPGSEERGTAGGMETGPYGLPLGGTETGMEAVGAPGKPVETTALESDRVRFRFTTAGGGLDVAEMLHHTVELGGDEPVTFNRPNRKDRGHPIGSLVRAVGDRFESLDYEMVEQGEKVVAFSATDEAGLEVEKRFVLHAKTGIDEADPSGNLLDFELSLRNGGGEPVDLAQFAIYGGAVAADDPRHQLETGFFWKDGGKFTFHRVDWMKSFMLRPERETYIRETGQLRWAGVQNQFFTTVMRPLEPLDSRIWVHRFDSVVVGQEALSARMKLRGVESAIGLPMVILAPGETRVFRFEIYTGPKQYARLAQLPDSQKQVMAYDSIPIMGPLFGWIITPIAEGLVMLLVWFDKLTGNFGIAVLLLTVVVRALMWPLHAKAHATSKRMAALAPKMNELKEKYPDDPQKMQQEQMKLWSDYGVNPMGGCLPAFVQMPIFIGYFRMLASAAELRHEPFFGWIRDLSVADTIGYFPSWMPFLGGIPINLLPFLMALTSFGQFALMPKTGDKNQRIIFMMFPIMFLFFCYSYASALALYWTWSNVISIGQTWWLNKRPLPELKKVKKRKSGWMERLQAQAEAAQKAQAAQRKGGGGGGGGGTRSAGGSSGTPSMLSMARGDGSSGNFGDKGPRKQKPKPKAKSGRVRRKRK